MGVGGNRHLYKKKPPQNGTIPIKMGHLVTLFLTAGGGSTERGPVVMGPEQHLSQSHGPAHQRVSERLTKQVRISDRTMPPRKGLKLNCGGALLSQNRSPCAGVTVPG
ncbi:unnamed protein product [Lepidochelys kempii]